LENFRNKKLFEINKLKVNIKEKDETILGLRQEVSSCNA